MRFRPFDAVTSLLRGGALRLLRRLARPRPVEYVLASSDCGDRLRPAYSAADVAVIAGTASVRIDLRR